MLSAQALTFAHQAEVAHSSPPLAVPTVAVAPRRTAGCDACGIAAATRPAADEDRGPAEEWACVIVAVVGRPDIVAVEACVNGMHHAWAASMAPGNLPWQQKSQGAGEAGAGAEARDSTAGSKYKSSHSAASNAGGGGAAYGDAGRKDSGPAGPKAEAAADGVPE